MSDSQLTSVRKYLRIAVETLEEADTLRLKGQIRGAINRMYYASFYAVSALLLSDGLQSKKHTGVLSLFNKNYVQTGVISKELARFYGDVFDLRNGLDYLRNELLEPGEIDVLHEKSKALIKTIQSHLGI